MKVLLKTVFIYFLLVVSVFGQTNEELIQYQKAKKAIADGKYQEGLQLIEPFTNKKKYGNLAGYASFHSALASFHLGKVKESISLLKELQNEKAWEKNDDLRYLLALGQFKEDNYLEALETINLITDPKIFSEAENATYNHLKPASLSLFIPNISRYSRNNGFVMSLKEKMESNTILSNEEKGAYNELKKASTANQSQKNTSSNKQSLDISLILPFNHSGSKGVSQLSPNNFVFEFYQGFTLGVEELVAKGSAISVAAFDSERSVEKVQRILNQSKMSTSDVIIGPLYPEEIEPVIDYTEKNKINWINPLSNVDEKLEQNQYSYLFRPSINTLSEGILDYIKFNLLGKRIAIGYSGVTRDELMAKKIKEISEKYNIEIVTLKKINERDVRSFVIEQNRLNLDAILLFTDDPNIASPVFGLLESVTVSSPIFVMDSWLYFNFANYEMFNSQKIYFVGNNSINFQADFTEKFRSEFFQKYQMHPSINAYLGYELIYWLSQTISPQAGFDLRNNLNSKGKFLGTVTYGFDFEKSNSNKYIPILMLVNGELVIQ
jgi:hypothetical protein